MSWKARRGPLPKKLLASALAALLLYGPQRRSGKAGFDPQQVKATAHRTSVMRPVNGASENIDLMLDATLPGIDDTKFRRSPTGQNPVARSREISKCEDQPHAKLV